MDTVDLVSAVVSLAVVGALILKGGLLSNTVLIAQVAWNGRSRSSETGATRTVARTTR